MLQHSVIRQQHVETLPGPYLLFLGDTTEPGYAKTAYGLARLGAGALHR